MDGLEKNDAKPSTGISVSIDTTGGWPHPLTWLRGNYSCGLPSAAHRRAMALASLLFAALAALLLPRLEPHAPLTLPQSAALVWPASLLLCAYLFLWTCAFLPGAAAAFLRVSRGPLLAGAASGLFGPAAGVAAAHLSTAWAAGLLGHALAGHRMRAGDERAADEAAARAPSAPRSEAETLAFVDGVALVGMVTLVLAARVAWLVFLPGYSGVEDGRFLLVELSVLVSVILYFAALPVVGFSLRQALVSLEFMARLFCYYVASILLSILFRLVDPWLWIYFFGMEMMAMAAFLGYILAVNARCKSILLAREKPVLKDLELGDVDQETASASTGAKCFTK